MVEENLKAKAEVYYGDEACREKSMDLLREAGLPMGLLPLGDIIECGHVQETGFVWLKQRKKKEHYFEKVGRHVAFAAEITAHVEKHRLKKVTGVKVKELLLWLPIAEVSIDGADPDPTNKRVTCKTFGGLFKTFSARVFEVKNSKQ